MFHDVSAARQMVDATVAPGAARLSDGLAEPDAAERPASAGHFAGAAPRIPDRRPVPGSGPLQAHQRFPGARDWRSVAAGGGDAPATLRSGARTRSAARAATSSSSCSPSWTRPANAGVGGGANCSAALTVPYHIGPHDLHVPVSIGISIYPDDANDADTLINNADTAMYYAKENGRHNYQFFKQEMIVRAVERQFIESSLRARAGAPGVRAALSAENRPRPPAPSSASKRCCAGSTRNGASFRRRSSCPSRRTPA